MKKYSNILVVFFLINIFMISFIFSQNTDLDTDKLNRLNFGHVLNVKEISTEPSELIPGNPGYLKLTLYNNGVSYVSDIRAKLYLPAEIGFYKDISEEKISRLESLDNADMMYNIIVLPNSAEGIYKGTLTIYYLNHIGEEKQDNYSISFIVKSSPKLFAEIEKSELYEGNNIGTVTIDFINNDLGNIKFLTVELDESKDYQIISSNQKYIGDLDSDDFQSVDFKLNVNKKAKEIKLPLKISYRDSLNKEYADKLELNLKIRLPKDIGIKTKNTLLIITGLVAIIFIILYYFYRKKMKRITDKMLK